MVLSYLMEFIMIYLYAFMYLASVIASGNLIAMGSNYITHYHGLHPVLAFGGGGVLFAVSIAAALLFVSSLNHGE